MVYNPTTDFVALWRAISGGVEKGEMPGLDFVVLALGRAGLLNLVTSTTAPLADQATTAWFQPVTPSYTAEGTLWLWDANAGAYALASPQLFFEMLTAAVEAANSPIALLNLLETLGNTEGDILVRGPAHWQRLAIGPANYVLTSLGSGAVPAWTVGGVGDLSALLDTIGSTEGDMLVRGATVWEALAAGTNGYILTSGGPGAVPAWSGSLGSGVTSLGGATGAITLQSGMAVTANKLSFLDTGTLMTFHQTSAPTGWTKQTTHNDKTFRVVSGAVSAGGSVPFSTVFAQTGTAAHTLDVSEIPAHSHSVTDPGHSHTLNIPIDASAAAVNTFTFAGGPSFVTYNGNTSSEVTGITIANAGGGGGHLHTMDIRVQYVDLIIASKDA